MLDIALSREMFQLPLFTGTQQSWMTVYVSKKNGSVEFSHKRLSSSHSLHGYADSTGEFKVVVHKEHYGTGFL